MTAKNEIRRSRSVFLHVIWMFRLQPTFVPKLWINNTCALANVVAACIGCRSGKRIGVLCVAAVLRLAFIEFATSFACLFRMARVVCLWNRLVEHC